MYTINLFVNLPQLMIKDTNDTRVLREYYYSIAKLFDTGFTRIVVV